jgi:hypothetical protein
MPFFKVTAVETSNLSSIAYYTPKQHLRLSVTCWTLLSGIRYFSNLPVRMESGESMHGSTLSEKYLKRG